jgi:hypothetical protein
MITPPTSSNFDTVGLLILSQWSYRGYSGLDPAIRSYTSLFTSIILEPLGSIRSKDHSKKVNYFSMILLKKS